jgi:hypothetical protein
MATFERASAAKKRHSSTIMGLPNVTGVSTGREVRDGRETDEFVIVVFVSHKVPVEDLAEHERIPSSCDGVPTQVRVEQFEKRNDSS